MSSGKCPWSGDDDGGDVWYRYSPLPTGKHLPRPTRVRDSAGDGVEGAGGHEHGHAPCVDEPVVLALPAAAPLAACLGGSPPEWSEKHRPYASSSSSSSALSGHGSLRSSQDAWSRGYRRGLTMTFHGAVFALGLFLGTL